MQESQEIVIEVSMYTIEEYKPWMRKRNLTPTELELEKEISQGFYDDEFADPFPFNQFSDGLEDDYGDESNP